MLAYDIVLDWSIFHKGALDFTSMDELDEICKYRLRHIDSIVNISSAADSELDIGFYYNQTSKASVLHAKPALAFRHNLIANRSLDSSKFTQNKTIFSYDAQWQFPAITEQYAFQRANDLLPDVQNVKYFAFPWATLFDLRIHKKNSLEMMRLMAALYYLKRKIGTAEKIVTVCQHILALEFQWLFNEVGITDLFWSHAKIEEEYCPFFENIKIHPFPLYPVQAIADSELLAERTRNTLYSFVGAKAKYVNPEGKGGYLTNSRNWIIDNLSSDLLGKIISRESWHYDGVVYKEQIGVEFTVENQTQQASEEFIKILRDSIFSLCPSGTGPNSIRLWESIGMGAIPVILADTYLPPGNRSLWEEAAIFCPETVEAIKALPDRLAVLAKDQVLLARKRHAMKQLWMLYGPDCFIYDIQKLLVEFTGGKQSSAVTQRYPYFETLLTVSKRFKTNQSIHKEDISMFLMGCSSRAMANPGGFLTLYTEDEQFRHAYQLAMSLGEEKYTEIMLRVLQQKKINIDIAS
jgi:hypothetical protein